ncbi:helix-turn-helix domain-containing protein [Amycolatopsis sp. NPDC049691]|uniref:TetR/AcrR family transcriptional regulator n=1 Tax=Amycolatopsis sp. NPDC049691 TaxID=3155155 RepID=UPI00343DBFCC
MAQARETRRRILAAAHTLFVTKGYGRTTIADVAAEAGVAPETVYSAFKHKPALLHRTWDVTVGGDDEDVPMLERPEPRALFAEIDRQRLESMGGHAREAAAAVQPDVGEQECRDVLFATTDGTLWHQLVERLGWSDERYAAWLGRLWVASFVLPFG